LAAGKPDRTDLPQMPRFGDRFFNGLVKERRWIRQMAPKNHCNLSRFTLALAYLFPDKVLPSELTARPIV
jgi:hypothetical protein